MSNTSMLGILRAVFFPQSAANRQRAEPADLTAFREASVRMNKSVKRLSKAVDSDNLEAMIRRMQNGGKKRTRR